MFRVGLTETVENRRFERRKVRIVFRVQTFFLDKLPEPFDQVKVRRVSRQETQFNIEAVGQGHDECAFLITGIIQEEGDRHAQVERRQFSQQVAHTFGIDLGIIRHRDQFMREGIQGPQDIEALASGGGFDEYARETPQEAETGGQNKMGCIHKENGSLTGLSIG